MLARFFTIASFTGALSAGLAAAPAEATDPSGRQTANGTPLSGVWFQRRMPDWINLTDKEFAIAADHLDPADVFMYLDADDDDHDTSRGFLP